MTFPKSTTTLILIILCTVQIGCNKSSPKEILEKCFVDLKPPTVELRELLTGIVDEASALEALSKLPQAVSRMNKAEWAVQFAEETSARSTIAIKAEIRSYMAKEKELRKSQIERMNRVPGVMKHLSGFFEANNMIGPGSF